MNGENLKKIADYIQSVPHWVFDMNIYRNGQDYTPECDSVGCVLGHSVVLDPKPELIPRDIFGDIEYGIWSEQFTGLKLEDDEWDWCFHSEWAFKDNTPEGASKRIYWLLDQGLPEDWRSQMCDKEIELCYI